MGINTVVTPNGTDDTQAIQNAINSGGTVELFGAYKVTKPLSLPTGAVFVGTGQSPAETVIQAMGYFPAIVRVPAYVHVPVSGDALLLDGSLGWWINLTADCWFAQKLTGITPWSVSFDIIFDQLPPDARSIIASQGAKGLDYNTFRQGFVIYQTADGLDVLWYDEQNVRHGFNPPIRSVFQTGELYSVKFTLDGTNATVMINDTVVATTLAGPIYQAWYEDVCIGACPIRWPDWAIGSPMPFGKISNLHMTGSGIGGGTVGDIAPKFAECYGPMVPIDSGFGRHWTVMRSVQQQDFGGVTLRNFAVQGGTGIFLCQGVNSIIEGITVNQANAGIVLWNNCYNVVMRDIHIDSCGRVGIAWVGAANQNSLVSFKIEGPSTIGVLLNDGNGVIRDGEIAAGGDGTPTRCALMAKSDWFQLLIDNVDFSDEGQTVSVDHGFYFEGAFGLSIRSGELLIWNSPAIPITIVNSKCAVVDGLLIGLTAATPALVDAYDWSNGQKVQAVSPPQVRVPDLRIGVNSANIASIPILLEIAVPPSN